METQRNSRQFSLHCWWTRSVAVALPVLLVSVLGLLDGIDGWVYKMIVTQIGSDAVQNQLAVAAAKNAFDALSIVEPTQPHNLFQQVSPAVTAVLVTVAAFAAVWFTIRFHLVVALGLAASLSASYVLVAGLMSLATHWVLDISAAVIALALGVGVTATDAAFQVRRQRRFSTQVFSPYVPDDLAEDVWLRRKQFLPGSRLFFQRLPVTVLFAELRGFVPRSGGLDAGIVTKWMAEYLDTMARLVVEHRGLVEQYFGDALKACFGAPFPRADSDEIQSDASQAVACAVAMGEALQVLNRRWQERGFPLIDMRIGLSTGEVEALCVGRIAPLKFTTMGEAVRCAWQLVRHPYEPDDPALSPGSCRILFGAPTTAHFGERFWLHRIEIGSGSDRHPETAVYRVLGKHDRPVFKREADLRVSSRVEIMMPVTLTYGSGAIGLTSNIGVGGMALCRLIQPLPIGAMTMLQFDVPGHAHPIKTEGTVVWSNQDKAGIAFAALTYADRTMLDLFLNRERPRSNLPQ